MHTPRITLLAVFVGLLVPATAAAHHPRGVPTFERAFPGESRLCARVADGDVPPALVGSEAQVQEACTALHAAFDAAIAGATGAPDADALKAAIAQAREAVEAACGPDATDVQACDDALHEAHDALKDAARGNHRAKRAYKRALREARRDFRVAIKSLAHGGEFDKHHEPKPEEPGDSPAGDDAPNGDAPTGDTPTED
jgi:hypothetical protein